MAGYLCTSDQVLTHTKQAARRCRSPVKHRGRGGVRRGSRFPGRGEQRGCYGWKLCFLRPLGSGRGFALGRCRRKSLNSNSAASYQDLFWGPLKSSSLSLFLLKMGKKRKESVCDFPVKIHVRIQGKGFTWCWQEQIFQEVSEPSFKKECCLLV